MYFLFTDETKITEPFGSDATDELEEVVDNTATFGDGLNDHSGGGEGEEGSGVSPAGAGAGTGGPPPHIKLLIWIKKRCFRICVRLIPRHPFNQCVHHCVHLHLVHFYCKAHPWKCSKKTQADEKQEGIPFIEKESAQAWYSPGNQFAW